MKNKKTLLCISAIMILIYHLWVPIFNNDIERYLRYICYIGVDIFFFISAYSLGKRKIVYKDFIKNRFINIYMKFIIFTILVTLYKGNDISKLIEILLGINFITKGGGSFLWFIPAIMILYLLFPLYKKLDDKYKIISPIILIITWLIISIMVTIYTDYKAIFIFTNRIPIFLIGYYISKYKVVENINKKKLIYYLLTIILLIIGSIISYTVYKNHFKLSWLQDMFYIVNIPLILGLILLIDKIPSNKIIETIGNVTLELYAFQMIFGFVLVIKLYKRINNGILTNLSVFLILFIMSYIFYLIYDKVTKKLNN